ncbi:MAG: cysteine desulfurase family protein [Candidatus Baltobacteraceae bacterium]
MGARIYADHAATTPVRPEVVEAMLPHFGDGFNPSSLHGEGRRARAALDRARVTVAALLGAAPREIVFTGSGSEADNLAILGVARAHGRPGHAVTSAVEHHAVLHAFDVLRDAGWEVTVLGADPFGRVDPAALEGALRPQTALVSLMLANNELGTLNPIAELARIARGHGAVFHTDAVAAPGRVPLDVSALGVDLLSLSAHKFYGPKGSGALYVRGGTPLAALVVGGGQEAGLRAGTENVAGIVGFARALELSVAELPGEVPRLSALRDRFEAGVSAAIGGVRLNGAGALRLPNVSSVAFAGTAASETVIGLDLEGVAVSAGSACAAGSTQPSHVLAALDVPLWAKTGTVRFSFGKLTREEDVEALVRMLPRVIAALRGAS